MIALAMILAAPQLPDATVSGADREFMSAAAKKCGLTNWDVSFVVYPSAPFEPVIHIEPKVTETQARCVLEHLPPDVRFKFGEDVQFDRKP